MKIYLTLVLLLFTQIISANQFESIDKSINVIIQSWLTKSVDNKTYDRLSCYPQKVSLNALNQCHQYINSIYITEDIDSYLSYVKLVSYFGGKAQNLSVYNRIINAQYEETTSELYFHIAHAAYKNQRYEESIKFLKKIDDTLDDESVYHALLIYGLIYFEKGDVGKSKEYFKRIDSSSSYYASALYNLGLINMRSLWWADAESYLNKSIAELVKKELSKSDLLMLDKLYLTVGYSQMSRKNFRLSIKSFSNMSLDSPIKMRGLMGIALSEIGLGNIGKAATILKHIRNKGKSTVKLDALVTLPQVYQKAGNMKETVSYYESAIVEMNTYIIDQKLYDFESDWNVKNIDKRLSLLNEMLGFKLIGSREKTRLKKVKSKVLSIKKEYVTSKNNKILVLINDYIKQSKYALAVIYDKSVVSSE